MLLPPRRSFILTCLIAGAVVLPMAAAQGSDISIFQRYMALSTRMDQAGREVAARRFEAAKRLLDPCLALVPDHFEGHFLLARIAYEGRDYAGALAHLEISERSLAELDRRYREEIADLKAQGEAEEQAMRSSLDNLYARGVDPNGCSAVLFTTKQNALEFLESKKGNLYQRENPFGVPADYRFLRGNCLYRLGRRAEAMAQYRLTLQTDPTHPNAWNNLISLQWETGDHAQARVDLGRAEAAHIAIRPELKQAVLAAAAQAPATQVHKTE
ncbi:MAG: tetratricopeptide repeat protein [Geothrix sp.]|nr:tetratricopeptide repeat protein [Geothrix sp.]